MSEVMKQTNFVFTIMSCYTKSFCLIPDVWVSETFIKSAAFRVFSFTEFRSFVSFDELVIHQWFSKVRKTKGFNILTHNASNKEVQYFFNLA
jgi:hypothetical protein